MSLISIYIFILILNHNSFSLQRIEFDIDASAWADVWLVFCYNLNIWAAVETFFAFQIKYFPCFQNGLTLFFLFSDSSHLCFQIKFPSSFLVLYRIDNVASLMLRVKVVNNTCYMKYDVSHCKLPSENFSIF